MITKKLLDISECKFALPDSFNGTLGEALMLLAQYRLDKEKKGQTFFKEKLDCYDALVNDDSIKSAIRYTIWQLSDDGIWEAIS